MGQGFTPLQIADIQACRPHWPRQFQVSPVQESADMVPESIQIPQLPSPELHGQCSRSLGSVKSLKL